MSHLYCQCQKHKHFGFSNGRFRRGSSIKSVYVILVVAVSLTTSRVIISAKYRRKTPSGLEPSFMCDVSLSFFPLGPPVYVCATLLWGQEGGVHCRVTACWICSPGPLSQASSSSEALDKTKLLDSWLLAVWWHGWDCDNPSTFSISLSTELMLLDTPTSSLSVSTISSDILRGCSNHGLLLHWLILHQHSWRLSIAEVEETGSLCNTTLWTETQPKVWEVKRNL